MRRLIVWILGIAVLLGASSYAVAQFKTRQVLGARSGVGAPASTFAYRGVPDLRGQPRAWVFTYPRNRLPGVGAIRIVVSPTGRVLAVTPPDLGERIEAYRRSLEP